MYVFVVTGRAGSQSWPAKVFNYEFAAHLFVQVAEVAAKSCYKDRLSISNTDTYDTLPEAGQQAVDSVLLAPFRALDPDCTVDPAIWHIIKYTVERVALHD
jgi:hypothetical protein